MSGDDTIAAAREAWARLCRRGQTTFDDWIAVGKAIVIARAECLRAAKCNRPLARFRGRSGIVVLNLRLAGFVPTRTSEPLVLTGLFVRHPGQYEGLLDGRGIL